MDSNGEIKEVIFYLAQLLFPTVRASVAYG